MGFIWVLFFKNNTQKNRIKPNENLKQFILALPQNNKKDRFLCLPFSSFCYENGKSVIYNISSHENFNILRVEGDKHRNVITLGCHTDESLQLINKFKDKIETTELIKFTYNSLADEQMGGILSLYIMTKKGIMYYEEYKIKDSKKLGGELILLFSFSAKQTPVLN